MSIINSVRDYGQRHMCDFPDSDDVLNKLNSGEIAHIREKGTEYDYILTKQLGCWTKINDFKKFEGDLNRHMEKVYEVEFMQYTNCMRDTVSDGNGFDSKYINVGKEPFLIKESEFERYMKFGGGFRIIRFVGNMEVL